MITSSMNHPLLPYTEKKLPSGLTLVHKEVKTAPIIGIDIWIHTGAIHDPEPHLGLSHFFEHMFFKGTEKYGVGVMDRIITSLGGYNNAATSLDYTHYYVVLPSSGWEQAMEVMLDSLQNPLFAEEEIERERAVIFEEIKRHEDNPWSSIYDKFTATAFSKNRYSRQVLGSKKSLKTITRKTFYDYLQDRYAPENISLCVVGDISFEAVEDKINSIIQKNNKPFSDSSDNSFPMIEEPGELILKRDVNQSYLLIGYPTATIAGTQEEYTLDLLSMIWGEGRSSRLHRRLNDELGIVSSISTSTWTLRNAGLFLVEAVTEPGKLKQVEQEIENEFLKLREKIEPEEIQKVKNMSHADYAFSNEKAISIAHTYGHSRVITSIEKTIRYLEEMEKIQAEDLYKAYDKFLIPQRKCRGLMLPKKG